MYKFVVFVIAVIALQGCIAKPKAKVEKSQLEELTAQAQTIVKNVQETFKVEDFDSQKIVTAVNTNTQELATKLQEFVDKIKAESKAHEGDVDNVLKQVEAKLTETAASLQKAAGPETTAKANELKADFEKNYKTTVAQVEKLVKSYQPQIDEAKSNIDSFSKSFLDQIVKIGNSVDKQVKDAVAEHEKTHKH